MLYNLLLLAVQSVFSVTETDRQQHLSFNRVAASNSVGGDGENWVSLPGVAHFISNFLRAKQQLSILIIGKKRITSQATEMKEDCFCC